MNLPHDLEQLALNWFKELLRIDTSNPPGQEKAAIEFVARELGARGISTKVLGENPKRPNLYAEVIGNSGRPPLLLSSHVDTVPVGDLTRWSVPPHSGEERDGMVWGRGAVDVKYKTAFDMAALVSHKISGSAQTLKMVALADEEEGFELGSKYVTSKHRALIDAQYVFNEVGGFNFEIAGREFIPIQAGEKGSLILKITSEGVEGHASMPAATSSIASISKIVVAISERFFQYRLCESSRVFFTKVKECLPPQFGALFAGLLEEASAEPTLAAIPDRGLASQLRAMLTNTVAPTVVRAGSKQNVIPGHAELYLDVRLIPGTTPQEFIQSLERFISKEIGAQAKSIRIEEIWWGAGYEISPSDPMLLTLGRFMESKWKPHLNGALAVPYLMPASSDNSNYFRAGIKPIGFAPLLFPKGFQGFALAHAIDERLPTESFKNGLAAYLGAIASL